MKQNYQPVDEINCQTKLKQFFLIFYSEIALCPISYICPQVSPFQMQTLLTATLNH